MVVSRIGIASNKIGTRNELIEVFDLGCNLMVKEAINTPRNKAPASPIYIFAGLLFQTRKPKVAPAVTVASAATRY
jgi:hypothetical protein